MWGSGGEILKGMKFVGFLLLYYFIDDTRHALSLRQGLESVGQVISASNCSCAFWKPVVTDSEQEKGCSRCRSDSSISPASSGLSDTCAHQRASRVERPGGGLPDEPVCGVYVHRVRKFFMRKGQEHAMGKSTLAPRSAVQMLAGNLSKSLPWLDHAIDIKFGPKETSRAHKAA